MSADQNARPLSGGISVPVQKEGGVAAFRFLEHTADMGIEAQAQSREELFVQAAKGLLLVLAGSAENTKPVCVKALAVTACDVEELLVVWLNELLYFVQTKNLWPVEIEIVAMRSDRLEVKLSLAQLSTPVQREVKAVTYHHLMVHCRQGVWRARVYLDI